MKKIRDGKSGELTAEIFETWFPEKPEVILLDFLKTGLEKIVCVKKMNETDVCISHITREYAQKLLDEFKILRGKVG
jgi:hypothetical protein